MSVRREKRGLRAAVACAAQRKLPRGAGSARCGETNGMPRKRGGDGKSPEGRGAADREVRQTRVRSFSSHERLTPRVSVRAVEPRAAGSVAGRTPRDAVVTSGDASPDS